MKYHNLIIARFRGSVRAIVDGDTGSVVETNDYYPFGKRIAISTEPVAEPVEATSPNRWRFSGKEDQSFLSAGIPLLDFGARMYDPTIVRWTTIDPLADDYYNVNPYGYCVGNPISFIDLIGESIYLLFYTTGNGRGDSMFKAAAETRKRDIEQSDSYNSSEDIVLLQEIQDISNIGEIVSGLINEYSEHYGKTSEFSIWSHAGLDGPRGTVESSNYAVDKAQMSLEGWSTIDFNWAKDATANFFGCRTGVDNEGGQSFTTRISSLKNFENVLVSGQTNYSFPSKWVDTRTNDKSMIKGIFSYPTYMVSGGQRSLKNRFVPISVKARKMSVSYNGIVINKDYQRGRHH